MIDHLYDSGLDGLDQNIFFAFDEFDAHPAEGETKLSLLRLAEIFTGIQLADLDPDTANAKPAQLIPEYGQRPEIDRMFNEKFQISSKKATV